MFRLFGVKQAGFDGDLNRIIADRIHPDDTGAVMESNRRVLEEGAPGPLSYRIVLPDGKQRTVWAQRKRLYDENGQPVCLTGYVQDITERIQAEEALKRNERVLRLFAEHSPASIAMFDRDMRYIVASRRYLVDYRSGDQDLTGRCHYEAFPEMPERWKEIHRRCLQGAIEKAEEDPFPREDGKLDWVRWEIHPWYEESGRVGGIILFSEVITDRKQMQDDLRLLNLSLEQRVMERTL